MSASQIHAVFGLQFKIPQECEVLFFRALNLPQRVDQETSRASEKRNVLVAALEQDAAGILQRYRAQLGGNAYAIFNAITDFASHPPELPGFHRTHMRCKLAPVRGRRNLRTRSARTAVLTS